MWICAGWLLRGAHHNASIQRAVEDGTLPLPELPPGVELYDSYEEMAVANGVDPDDPALAATAPVCDVLTLASRPHKVPEQPVTTD